MFILFILKDYFFLIKVVYFLFSFQNALTKLYVVLLPVMSFIIC